MKVADILLPLPIQGSFSYLIPKHLAENVKIGVRAIVPFHTSRLITGIVKEVGEMEVTPEMALREIDDVLDDAPIITENQPEFWQWIADYYMCHIGEVLNAALPSLLKLSSHKQLLLHPNADENAVLLTDDEYLIYEALLHQQKLTVDEVAGFIKKSNIHKVLGELTAKNIIVFHEELQEEVKPKTDIFYKVGAAIQNQEDLEKTLNQLEKKAYAQLEIMLRFVHLSRVFTEKENMVSRKDLMKDFTNTAALNALVKKQILKDEEKEVGRISAFHGFSEKKNELNHAQFEVFQSILNYFNQDKKVLLHGITSSGKTEVYIHLIEHYIRQNKSTLFLLPEISLTTQMIARLQQVFGNKVLVYHSKINDKERVEIWQQVAKPDCEYKVILSARSGIFLPINQLGLIIVDEEHDHSYKQFDPAPRYHARDCAVFFAERFKINILLASATPSAESYQNAISGKYAFLQLTERFGGIQMPDIQIADLKEKSKSEVSKLFTDVLIAEIQRALDHKEQIILFQNRRGFTPVSQCTDCGNTIMCFRCDVPLTYHKFSDKLKCHYCGHAETHPKACKCCGSTSIKESGFGTEKIEDEIKLIFPKIRVARIDVDTSSKNRFQKILGEFESRNIDLLIGTQMVTKGLDFDNVTLVGIMNADQMLKQPDFRAYERAFQMMDQVSGRAGRRKKQGKVIIQAYDTGNPILKMVSQHQYMHFLENQIKEREHFKFPPHIRLIKLSVRSKDFKVCDQAAAFLATKLRIQLQARVYGPEYPLIKRINEIYRKEILIKLLPPIQNKALKQFIRNCINETLFEKQHKKASIIIDVDPF